jgi:peptide chain release factor 1
MLDKLAAVEQRYQEIGRQLEDPNLMNDIKRMTQLSKEFKELGGIMDAYRRYKSVLSNLEGAREMLETEADEEMRDMAKDELATLEPRRHELEEELKQLLIPKDPEDSRNVVMEIRAGAGGDEAAIFAGNIFEMYKRYCERKGWKLEVTDFHEGTVGGYKEIVCLITGEDAYGTLKFESGAHRVQRVPDTETQGRVHTSAATVLVVPEADDIDIDLNMNDVRKDTFCSGGNGGQSVNTTYSAVRLTHLPTGITVNMQNERSQLKNFDLALKILKSRLYDLELEKRQSEEAKLRKSLVSSGDRSAKIRTYNYPQSRVTDHRIGLTVYNLPVVMTGDLDHIIESLRLHENASKLAVEQQPA